MSVRVRFAPSPTGYLHIGGARTALYNYLYAKAIGGTFILRIEDTDMERSKPEYEALQIEDLNWLGIFHDEGPDKPNPKYAPYRQSERQHIYMKYAQELFEKDLAYYDFSSDEELEAMKEKALRENRDPVYDGKWKNPSSKQEALAKVAAGEKGAIRFRAPNKPYVLNDKVKGRVVYPENMVGDFVIVRSNGLPVYNYCCVVDDMLMDITHVIRGEDHLNNTVRQLMIYEALNAKVPEFAHVSLLIGADRQKLSKRHGATSVNLYRNERYLPEALCNYLTLLGWSHPTERDIFDKEDLKDVFNLERFSASPAIYDLVKLRWVNGQHIKKMDNETLIGLVSELPGNDFFKTQTPEWRNAAIDIIKQQVEFVSDIPKMVDEMILLESLEMSDMLKDILSWETTPKIIDYIDSQVQAIPSSFITEAQLNGWMDVLKKDMGVKGKQLFMGVRAALTGKDHGPDLKILIPLTPVAVIKKRLTQLKHPQA
ncbi:MAG TPA: glutamate--tRNA ligase [Bacteriovoracaceae bacterium]|nr:glutamate--tRNA ligase [Bacteriovoracaceae bacterium]